MTKRFAFCSVLAFLLTAAAGVWGQTPPSRTDVESYTGLLAATASGHHAEMRRMIEAGADLNVRDDWKRTPLMVAAYNRDLDAARILIDAGADLNALDRQAYDVLTISGVADDPAMVDLALAHGADPTLTTSPYDGTALIASAHLGHVAVVESLIAAGAPLDHVNNLGWTALIEAIVLGDGGPDHTAIVRALVEAGADPNLADSGGTTPLALAKRRGYDEMALIIAAAGGRE